eukprot:366282-Chlamydomonas_euryale.AAC.15
MAQRPVATSWCPQRRVWMRGSDLPPAFEVAAPRTLPQPKRCRSVHWMPVAQSDAARDRRDQASRAIPGHSLAAPSHH